MSNGDTSSLLRDQTVEFLISQNSELFDCLSLRECECQELEKKVSSLKYRVEELQRQTTFKKQTLSTFAFSLTETDNSVCQSNVYNCPFYV